MGRERDNEKKFNEYLDRILAGEEIKADPSMDKELRDALDFACKMADLRQNPPAQFQARLKADLLQKIEARQAQKQARGAFWDVFRGHPVWQGAVAVLLVIIVIAVVWRAGVFQFTPLELSQATTPPATKAPIATQTAPMTTSPAYYDKGLRGTLVSIDAKSDKTSYQSGETVQIELSMKNISGNQLTVKDFPPILSVMREDTKQPVYTFTAGTATRTLAPNAVATYTYTWKQTGF